MHSCPCNLSSPAPRMGPVCCMSSGETCSLPLHEQTTAVHHTAGTCFSQPPATFVPFRMWSWAVYTSHMLTFLLHVSHFTLDRPGQSFFTFLPVDGSNVYKAKARLQGANPRQAFWLWSCLKLVSKGQWKTQHIMTELGTYGSMKKNKDLRVKAVLWLVGNRPELELLKLKLLPVGDGCHNWGRLLLELMLFLTT